MSQTRDEESTSGHAPHYNSPGQSAKVVIQQARCSCRKETFVFGENANAHATNLQHNKGYAVGCDATGILLSDSASVRVEKSAQSCDNNGLANAEERGECG